MTQRVHGAHDAKGCRKYLTRQEGLAFIESAKALPLRECLLCQVLYYTGSRPTELVRLRAADFDAADQVVQVECLKKRGKILIRRIPLPEWLLSAVLELGPAHADGRLWPVSRTTVWRLTKRVMDQLQISGIHACPKGLRHGLGVRAVLAKVPVHLVQRALGHSSPNTTAIYLEVLSDEERELMARTW